MIIDEIIKIKTNPSNYKHYKQKGYEIEKCGQEIEVKILDLPIKSHVKVNCKCNNCESTSFIEYHNYNRQVTNSYYLCKKCWNIKLKEVVFLKFGVDNVRKLQEINTKIKNTNLKKYGVQSLLELESVRNLVKEYYGVENISQLDSIKELKRMKSIEKFGTNTPLQNISIIEIIRKKNIENGRWSEYDLNKYSEYRKKIDYLTKKQKKKLFENWNGKDYYDCEYIRENLSLDKNHDFYPSIDHKISVMYGFLNEISPEEISKIDNLCITKRFLNTMKFTKNEDDFKKYLSENYMNNKTSSIIKE